MLEMCKMYVRKMQLPTANLPNARRLQKAGSWACAAYCK